MPRAAGSLVACLAFAGLAALGAPGARAADAGFALAEKPGESLDVLLDGRTVGRYMCAHDASTPEKRLETYKPFLHVFDAEGRAPITNGAGAKLYPHHRGIFIGWTKLTLAGTRYDLWGMGGGDQVHRKFLHSKAGPDQASFTSQVDWVDKAGRVLLAEERTMVFHRRPAPTLALIDFTSRLKAVAGDLVLDGDVEHAGVHYRPHDDVDRAATKYVFPKEGDDPKKDKDLAWAAEQYALAGKTYGVQQMNHPANPKDTAWSAYRDYGRFGAFFRHELKAGETLACRYRFRVVAGELPPRDTLQKEWEAYAKAPLGVSK